MKSTKLPVTDNDRFIKLDQTQQEYIRVYHAYFVLQWEMYELCEHFQCSRNRIETAIKWVIANKTNFPAEYLVEGAIYACRERLKQNRKLLNIELEKTKNMDKRFVVELQNMIRTEEDRLFKLQQIVDGRPSGEDAIKASDVLRLITAAQKQAA